MLGKTYAKDIAKRTCAQATTLSPASTDSSRALVLMEIAAKSHQL